MSHSTPSPNAEQRPNRFEDSTSTDVIQPNELGNHSSARATSQPPRSSSASSNPNYLPSPTATASRSPWSQPNPTQKTSADISRSRYPARGIPMPQSHRSSSFSGGSLGSQPHSFSGLGTSSGAGYFSQFGSTFEDDESLLEDAAFDNAGEDDDVDAMIGRLRPSVGPFDEYSDSPVYARKGVGFSAGSSVGGAGRYSVGGGRLPPSLSSSLSPSQLPGTHPLISPSPRSSTSSSLASHMMTRDDVRGRTYATDPSRSRSQSLATSTVGRGPTTGVGAAGMYGLPTHGYTRDTSGLGSTMASWNGNDSDHTFSILRERLDSSSRRSQYLYNEYGEYDYGDKDNSNQSPFLRDVDRMLPSGTSPVPRGIGLRNSLSRGYSSGAGGAGGFGGRYGGSELDDIPGSGATSRRHSVSVVQPVRRGSGLEDLAGSAVDDEFEYDYDYAHSQGRLGMSIGGGGGMAGMGRTISMSGGVSGTGRGSLMLSDDDLLDAGPPIPGMNQMSGGMHPMDALNNNFGMMNLNQSLYQHQQQQQSLDIPQQRRGSVSPGSLPRDGGLSGSSPGHHHQNSSSSISQSQEHTPQQHASQAPAALGLDGLAAGSSYAARARASSQSQGGTSPTMGRGMGLPPQAYYTPQSQQQGPIPMGGRRVSNASSGGPGPMLDMAYGAGAPHGHLPQQQPHPHHQPHQHPHPQHGQHPPHPQQQQPQPLAPENALGRGVPLSAVPPSWKLFIVEFKAGRTDLFYLTDAVKGEIMRNESASGFVNGHGQTNGNGQSSEGGDGTGAGTDSSKNAYPIKVGDLVIVEADRGRDLGRIVNDNISVEEVEAWLDAGRSSSGQLLDSSQQQPWGESPMPTPISPTGVYAGIPPPTTAGASSAPGGAGSGKKEINPKQIYGKAGPAEASVLAAKMSDEMKALQLCQSKVRAKKLPMEVVDAEYQWDRRKLTFYFVADKRIDFRELVRELFRLYKTRIWMASLQGGGGFEQ